MIPKVVVSEIGKRTKKNNLKGLIGNCRRTGNQTENLL